MEENQWYRLPGQQVRAAGEILGDGVHDVAVAVAGKLFEHHEKATPASACDKACDK